MKIRTITAALASVACVAFTVPATAAEGYASAQATTLSVGLTRVSAQVGDTVYGARGSTLGTVAGSDQQGNLQLETENGTVMLPAGLLSYENGRLSAPTTSPADLMAMNETQSE